MKQISTFLFLLFFSKLYGQEWGYDGIDSHSRFKHEYWIQFKNVEDISTYQFNQIEDKSISTIEVTNNKGDSLCCVWMTLNNLNTDSTFHLMTDLNGLGQIKLKPGKYNLEIVGYPYDKFSMDFSFSENESFSLQIKLGLAPELTIYQIHSKDKLSETDILSIVQCVKENRSQFYDNCSDKKKFYISIQI